MTAKDRLCFAKRKEYPLILKEGNDSYKENSCPEVKHDVFLGLLNASMINAGYDVKYSQEEVSKKDYQLSKRGFTIHQITENEYSSLAFSPKIQNSILSSDTQEKSDLIKLLGVEKREITKSTTEYTVRYEFYKIK